ncbi:MAG TPA: hypothetical protein EYP57_05150 [Thermodesulfobacteriaceae bacterium]|nr:hypothetical protein [Thermodesulfobacteriaceae bacterium]
MSIRTATLRMPQRQPYSSMGKRSFSRPRSTRKLRVSWKECIISVFAAAMLVLGLWTGREIRSIAKDLEVLQTEAVQLNSMNEKLSKDRDELVHSEQMKKIGRKLGLHPPRTGQVVYLK